jgi:hypothetical protein
MVKNTSITGVTHNIIKQSEITKQQYYEHIARLMQYTAQAKGPQAATIYSLLTEGIGAQVYAKMRLLQNEPATAEPFMLLTSLITSFGAAAGKSTAEIRATLEQAPLPETCRIDATIPLRIKENPLLAIERSKEELCKTFSAITLLEVAKEYMPERTTSFEKDFARQQATFLNGIAYPTEEERAAYRNAVVSIEERRLVFEQVRNHYTEFISGTPCAHYNTAPLEIKRKVNIMTSLLSQEIQKQLLSLTIQKNNLVN